MANKTTPEQNGSVEQNFWQAKKKIVVISVFVFFILAIGAFFIVPKNATGDLELVLFNIRSLKKNVEDIQTRIEDAGGRGQLVEGRIDPNIAKEFGEDEAFIARVIELKKERLVAQLSIEVADLKKRHQAMDLSAERQHLQQRIQELEAKLHEQNMQTTPAVDPWPSFSIIGINVSEGVVHIRMENQQIVRLSLGKMWREFMVADVARDFVRLRNTSTGDERSFYITN